MNFLFGAFLLILLLFPGVLFRVGYLSVPFSSKSFRSSLLEELLFSLAPGFLLQTIGYLVVECTGRGVNENLLFLLLINSDKSTLQHLSSAVVLPFAGYLFLTSLAAFWGGTIARRLSIRYRLHLRYPFLRIYNEWQLYFEGIVLDRPDVAGRSRDVEEVWLDVLVEAKNESYIYSGLLEDYVVDKDEKLDRIYLKGVRRRKLADDRKPEEPAVPETTSLELADYSVAPDSTNRNAGVDRTVDRMSERYYYMPGEYFVLPAAQIKNINIIYYAAETVPENEAQSGTSTQ